MLLFVSSLSAVAAQIALTPANVIGGSDSYGGSWNSGCFNATRILDTQSGPVSDGYCVNYWLNPDNGPANAYIVIDLGAAYTLGSIELFNGHNNGFNDRGTGNFNIQAGNAVADLGANGFDLTGSITTIVTGTLAPSSSSSEPIPAQTFSASGTYRYLRFNPTSVSTSGGSCCGANNYALAEMRVFESAAIATPEPGSVLLLIGGIAVLARRYRLASRS
jgi:hypothetical protein